MNTHVRSSISLTDELYNTNWDTLKSNDNYIKYHKALLLIHQNSTFQIKELRLDRMAKYEYKKSTENEKKTIV